MYGQTRSRVTGGVPSWQDLADTQRGLPQRTGSVRLAGAVVAEGGSAIAAQAAKGLGRSWSGGRPGAARRGTVRSRSAGVSHWASCGSAAHKSRRKG